MRYLPDRGLGLPLARTKDVSRLDDELLEKTSVQAGVPRGLVKDVAGLRMVNNNCEEDIAGGQVFLTVWAGNNTNYCGYAKPVHYRHSFPFFMSLALRTLSIALSTLECRILPIRHLMVASCGLPN
jgi:hypothetical protein